MRWHGLGKASEYTTQPRKQAYFGTRLVVYRGEEGGQVVVSIG